MEIAGIIALHDGEKFTGYHPVPLSSNWAWKDYVDAYGEKELEGLKFPVVIVPEKNFVCFEIRNFV